MKRWVSLLVFLTLIMVSSVVFGAYKPDQYEWQWVHSSDTTSIYVRNSSIIKRYDKSIDAEICYVYPNEAKYTIDLVRFLPGGHSYFLFRTETFDEFTHKWIKKESGILMFLLPSIPDTYTDYIYKHLSKH